MALKSGVIVCVGFACVLNVVVGIVRGVFMGSVWCNVSFGNAGVTSRRVATLNNPIGLEEPKYA
jgi:hypothetical protein